MKIKRKLKLNNIGYLLVLVWIFIVISIISTVAATNGSASIENLFTCSWEITNANNSSLGAAGTFEFGAGLPEGTIECTISATSSKYEAASGCPGSTSTDASNTTTTATITNISGSTIRINSVTSNNASAIVGVSAGNSVAPNGKFTIKITANCNGTTDTTSHTSSDIVTISYSKVENVDIAFYASSNVTYSYNGELVTNTDNPVIISQSPGSKIVLPTPEVADGFTFYGWRLGDGLRVDSGTEVAIDTDTTVYPVVYSGELVKPFTVEGSTYAFWEDAVYAAGADGVVVLNQDYTLPTTLESNAVSPAGGSFVNVSDKKLNYVVPVGVTLLIPHDTSYTVHKEAPPIHENAYTKPSCYCTLVMADGANIYVKGAISIASAQSSKMGYNGQPSGQYGCISMSQGSTITVESDAYLYAWGYIRGSGSVTAKSGATVYECFQVEDYRGGDATSQFVKNNIKQYRVFPMSQYYVQNVEVPLTFEAGAYENVHFSVYVTLAGVQKSLVSFIGPEDSECMFPVSSGSITKDYDEENDRLIIDIDGDVAVSNFSISIKVAALGSALNINTSDFYLPLNSNITVNLNSGFSTLKQDLALLPGSIINIGEEATLKIADGHKLVVYDADQWGKYCGSTNNKMVTLEYAPGRIKTRGEASLVDAVVMVNGTLDASTAYVYTTDSGANICSSKSGTIIVKADADTTVVYQLTQYKDGNSQALDPVEIPITLAKLKNEDGSYVQTHGCDYCQNTYSYSLDNSTSNHWANSGEHLNLTVSATNVMKCDHCGAAITHTYSDGILSITGALLSDSAIKYYATVTDGDLKHKYFFDDVNKAADSNVWTQAIALTKSAGIKISFTRDSFDGEAIRLRGYQTNGGQIRFFAVIDTSGFETNNGQLSHPLYSGIDVKLTVDTYGSANQVQHDVYGFLYNDGNGTFYKFEDSYVFSFISNFEVFKSVGGTSLQLDFTLLSKVEGTSDLTVTYTMQVGFDGDTATLSGISLVK